jgi:anthranilate synthase component 1
VEAGYAAALQRLDAMTARLRAPLQLPPTREHAASPPSWSSNVERDAFEGSVRRIKDYILAGDAFQVVLSQRFTADDGPDPFSLYRVLRTINPSPYMYFLRLPQLTVVGTSPEILVRVEGQEVEYRPIAGTRARGASEEEDRALEAELRSDAKERAEHVMLVDLGRNDIGRVCVPGSVCVRELMEVERYSHVMHLVSDIRGRLRPGYDGLDALRACFPAGTVTGAPKLRAMEIVAELEEDARGPYAGALGYVDFSGNLDMAITIRTVLAAGGRLHFQAGAGIVADSDPAREYEETLAKASVLQRAIALAAAGVDA